MLSVDTVSLNFGTGPRGEHGLDHVSIHLKPGEAYGLTGPSGSGKTTLARVMMGLVRPSTGHVWFMGRDVYQMTAGELRRYRRSVQILFQNPVLALDPLQPVLDSVLEPIRAHGIETCRSRAMNEAARILCSCGITEDMHHRYPHQISGGQAQRVALARALGVKPRMIIGDEPTAMLDVSVQAQILSFLKNLQLTQGTTLFLISHSREVLRRCCDRVAILDQGRITVQGSPAKVLPQHQDRPGLQPQEEER
ncbi:MAG: dipeptide/oligopeptide/nickel ABC transporter ATP-binding protein [Pseudomonadota bacterium]